MPNDMGGDTKNCPYCAEVIKAAAIKCKHCGSMLDAPVASTAAEQTARSHHAAATGDVAATNDGTSRTASHVASKSPAISWARTAADTLLADGPYDQVVEVALQAVAACGFAVTNFDPGTGTAKASAGASLRSWGEDFYVRITKADAAHTEVRFSSDLKFGLIDWGKNKDNIENVIAKVQTLSAPDTNPFPGAPYNATNSPPVQAFSQAGPKQGAPALLFACLLSSAISNVICALIWFATGFGIIVAIPMIVLCILEIVLLTQISSSSGPLVPESKITNIAIFEIIMGLFNWIALGSGIILLLSKSNFDVNAAKR